MASPHPIVKCFDQNTFKTDCEKLNDADEPELFLFSDCSGAKITFTFYSIRLETSNSDHHFLIVRLVARAGLCSRHTLPLEISIWLWARVLATCAGCTSPSEAFRAPPPPHSEHPTVPQAAAQQGVSISTFVQPSKSNLTQMFSQRCSELNLT